MRIVLVIVLSLAMFGLSALVRGLSGPLAGLIGTLAATTMAGALALIVVSIVR